LLSQAVLEAYERYRVQMVGKPLPDAAPALTR
jgi:hypothetical protein